MCPQGQGSPSRTHDTAASHATQREPSSSKHEATAPQYLSANLGKHPGIRPDAMLKGTPARIVAGVARARAAGAKAATVSGRTTPSGPPLSPLASQQVYRTQQSSDSADSLANTTGRAYETWLAVDPALIQVSPGEDLEQPGSGSGPGPRAAAASASACAARP